MSDSATDDIAGQLNALLDRLAPGDTRHEELEGLLTKAQSALPWPRVHSALLERVEELDTPRDRRALVLHATDPQVASEAAGKRGMEGVFEVLVAAADAPGLDAFLTRAHGLLEEAPELRRDLPTVERLIEITNQIEEDHEETADHLVNLAQRIEDLNEEVDA